MMRNYLKKNYKLLLLLSLILVVSPFKPIFLVGQESVKYSDTIQSEYYYGEPVIWGAGIFGGMLMNAHFVDFHALPNVPSCCPDYKTGFGFKYSFGGFFDYKFSSESKYFAQLRANYQNVGGLIQAEERELMFSTPTQSVLGLIEHSIETSINTISLQPIIKYSIFDNSFVHFGMSFSYLSSHSFEQKEVLVEPKDLVFENGSKIRMNYGGKIPGVSDFNLSLIGGVNYDFAITKKNDWFLSPELFLEYGLFNIIPKEKWNILSTRLALALNYRKGIEDIERFRQYERIDTVKIESRQIAIQEIIIGEPKIHYDSIRVKNYITITENYFRTDTLYVPAEYEMTGTMRLTALEDNGNEVLSPEIKVEEFLFNKMQPILNYVFFDSNSYSIPPRYNVLNSIEESNDFTLSKAFTEEELGFYHNILNVIGFKLRQNSDANITLIGCNNNLEAERNNLTLSRNRAQTIKDYLTNVWQIDPNRIDVKARNLPATPSNNRVLEGQEENRRVEIFSNNFRITSSLIAKDNFIEISFLDKDDAMSRKLIFGGFRIYTSVSSEKDIKNWKLAIVQGKDTLKTFTGSGYIPPSHNWLVSPDINKSDLLSKPIEFILSATDVQNKQVNLKEIPQVDVRTIAVKRQNRDKDIKRDSYSMMLFEFASARFTEENKDFPNIVRRLLKDESQVEVIGYSDALGDDNYNLRLSTQRAQAVAKAINHPNITAKGVGETILLYDNSTPEGRFYCRTVDIIAETPFSW